MSIKQTNWQEQFDAYMQRVGDVKDKDAFYAYEKEQQIEKSASNTPVSVEIIVL